MRVMTIIVRKELINRKDNITTDDTSGSEPVVRHYI